MQKVYLLEKFTGMYQTDIVAAFKNELDARFIADQYKPEMLRVSLLIVYDSVEEFKTAEQQKMRRRVLDKLTREEREALGL